MSSGTRRDHEPATHMGSGLWLGSAEEYSEAGDAWWAGIGLVVRCCFDGECRDEEIRARPGVAVVCWPMNDSGRDLTVETLHARVEKLAGFVTGSDLGVFVHCFAGVSRSVAIVTALWMSTKKLTFDEAYTEVCRLRPSADTNYKGLLRNYSSFLYGASAAVAPSLDAAETDAEPKPRWRN
jgi:hypothetical protein